jgi:hypothetical protein
VPYISAANILKVTAMPIPSNFLFSSFVYLSSTPPYITLQFTHHVIHSSAVCDNCC